MVNKATCAAAGSHEDDLGAAQLGIGQGVLDAVDEGCCPPIRQASGAAGGRLGRSRRRNETRVRRRTATRCCRRDPRRRCRLASPRGAQEIADTPRGGVTNAFYGGDDGVRIEACETRRYRFPLDPPFRRAWDPVPRTSVDATLVIVRADDGTRATRAATTCRTPTLLGRCVVGADPFRTEAVREIFETVDFHGGRPWTVEVASGTRRAARSASRSGGCWAAAPSACSRTPRPVSPSTGEGRARAVGAARPRRAGIKIRFHHDDWRRDVEVVGAGPRRGRRRRCDHGRRQPGLADARRYAPRPGTSPRRCAGPGARATGAAVAGGAAADRRHRRLRRLRMLTGVRIAAGEVVRHEHEARDLLARGGVDVIQCDVLCRGHRRLPADSAMAELAAGRGRRTPGRTATGWWRTCMPPAGLEPSLHRGAVRPSGLDAGPARLAAAGAGRVAADGTVAPPPGPGLGVEPDLDALERWRTA